MLAIICLFYYRHREADINSGTAGPAVQDRDSAARPNALESMIKKGGVRPAFQVVALVTK